MGLGYLMRNRESTSFPPVNRIYNCFEDYHSHLFSNSPTFQVFSKFPWSFANFPDLEKVSFPDFFP